MDYVTAENHVRRTGEWWVYSEYSRNDDLRHCKFQKDAVELGFSEIKGRFDSMWYKEQMNRQTHHPLVSIFFPGVGTSPLEYITQLGLDIIDCSKVKNVDLILKRLLNASQYNSARFELEVSAFFMRQGYDVGYNPFNNEWEEGPDLSISNRMNTMYVECKAIEQSYADHCMSAVVRMAHEKLYDVKAKIMIDYSRDILDLFRGKLTKSAEEIIANIVTDITNPIMQKVAKEEFTDLNIPGLADVKFALSDGVTGAVGGRFPILSSAAELERVIANAVDKGIKQLNDKPGLIAVSHYLGMNVDLAETVLDAVFKSHSDTYKNLVGVMFVNWLYHELPRGLTYHHFIVENQYADHTLKGLGFEKVISTVG
ncbi:MAG: hypothetical protein HMLIMOIP_001815 [Candidatus Nitrosomirales archaeon]|jgi:hypothetical protein